MTREELHENQNSKFTDLKNKFTKKMDEIRLHNRELHDEDVQRQIANNPYQPVPVHRHHVARWFGIIVIVLVIFAGYGLYQGSNNGNNTANATQPQTEQPANTNNEDKKAQANQDRTGLIHEMQDIQLDSQKEQELINAYDQQNTDNQIAIYNQVQKVLNNMPNSNMLKRSLADCLVAKYNLSNN